jgi:heptosyltransferase-2
LGAIGDVIRSTPIVTKLRAVHPGVHITWLTLTPDILPSVVDRPLGFTLANTDALRSQSFDELINLDKDAEACALADQVTARVKRGFILRNGIISPANADADHKYRTGLFNDVSKANTKSYPEELFEMCGFVFNGERYLLDVPAGATAGRKGRRSKPVVGLNTGCGERWTSRLWKDAQWVALAKGLRKKGYDVTLLGGEQEDKKNRSIAKASGARYGGHHPLKEFIGLVNTCDMVVTGVTMAMHVTIALGKRIVLFNNIFNRNEFHLYGLGEIVEPSRPCECFYKPTCTNAEYTCMDHLSVASVLAACERVLPRRP